MSRTRQCYAPEFRRQMFELVQAGRSPEALAREFEPAAIRDDNGRQAPDLVDRNFTAEASAIPTHTSLPPCSPPSRTSPAGGPKTGPSLTAAPRDGRTIVRAGTEEWLRRGPNQRMFRSRRAT